MKKETVKSVLLCVLGSMILAGTIMLVQDLYSLWTYRSNSCVRFLLAFAALTVLFAILFRKRPKLLCKVGLLFLAFVCFACVCVAFWYGGRPLFPAATPNWTTGSPSFTLTNG